MSDNPRPQLTPEIEFVIDRIAAKVAQDAVEKHSAASALTSQTLSDLRAWHADQSWTRNAREGVGKLSLNVKTTLLTSVTKAICYLIWRAIQSGGAGN